MRAVGTDTALGQRETLPRCSPTICHKDEAHHDSLPFDGRSGGSIGQRKLCLQGVVPMDGQGHDCPCLTLCLMLHIRMPGLSAALLVEGYPLTECVCRTARPSRLLTAGCQPHLDANERGQL